MADYLINRVNEVERAIRSLAGIQKILIGVIGAKSSVGQRR